MADFTFYCIYLNFEVLLTQKPQALVRNPSVGHIDSWGHVICRYCLQNDQLAWLGCRILSHHACISKKLQGLLLYLIYYLDHRQRDHPKTDTIWLSSADKGSMTFDNLRNGWPVHTTMNKFNCGDCSKAYASELTYRLAIISGTGSWTRGLRLSRYHLPLVCL